MESPISGFNDDINAFQQEYDWTQQNFGGVWHMDGSYIHPKKDLSGGYGVYQQKVWLTVGINLNTWLLYSLKRQFILELS